MSKHAVLSASGAKKWMSCPPSARLEKQFPESKSEYAAEGSFAHAFAELILEYDIEAITEKEFNKGLELLKKDPFYSTGLEEHVRNYTDLVISEINEANVRCNDPVILLEQKLDFSAWVPEGFGTGDVVIISDGMLEIIDLKYGKGVPVSAEGNPQLRLYGLGAFNTYSCLYDFDCIKMTIIQPRLDSISSEEISIKGLLDWAETEVKPKADLAIKGEGEFKAGDHCQFCRAKATCRARAEENLELAKFDFAEPSLLSEEEIAEVLTKADQLKAWAGDIQDYAFDQALNQGVKWPGWKLVAGRSIRKYLDEEAVAAKLIEEEYPESVIFEKKLLGITAMEKKIGKQLFEEYLKDLIVKPEGKPTLVVESDKRPEISSTQSAIEDFK